MPSSIVVVDLEATCWEGDEDRRADMETIEIGAVKLDGDLTTANESQVHAKLMAADEFQVYIKPVVEPTLSDFCTELTGITQEQVDAGVTFTEAFGLFAEWAGDRPTLASWGHFDITQLDKDCRKHGIATPHWVSPVEHINLKARFEDYIGFQCKYISDGIAALELEFEGRSHSGLDDARNAARILAYLAVNT